MWHESGEVHELIPECNFCAIHSGSCVYQQIRSTVAAIRSFCKMELEKIVIDFEAETLQMQVYFLKTISRIQIVFLRTILRMIILMQRKTTRLLTRILTEKKI